MTDTLTHKVHDTLPSGFRWADRLQQEQYDDSGFINGASKVCFVTREVSDWAGVFGFDIAVRLRPPRDLSDISSSLIRREMLNRGFNVRNLENPSATEWYILEYNRGWAAAGRPGVCLEWDEGRSTFSFDDGYLDRSAGRGKWHLTYCTNHDECGEG